MVAWLRVESSHRSRIVRGTTHVRTNSPRASARSTCSPRRIRSGAPPPLACRQSVRYYTEPHGSVFEVPPRRLVRRALGRHPTRRSGAARTRRRVDHGPCREVPHDPHGHEEARRRLGAGRARHDGEGRARADLQARSAPTGGRDGMDREVPPALGRTLRRAGQGCRGTETEGEG